MNYNYLSHCHIVLLFLIISIILIESSPLQKSRANYDLGECGQVDPRLSRVLSGEDAQPHEFPWMVSIKSKSKVQNGGHFCGGFIINKRHIISAAHCFQQKYNNQLDYSDGLVLPGSMTVSLGQHDLSVEGLIQNATIEYIALHPEFEQGGYLNNDIAILRTSQEITWDRNLRPICLPNVEDGTTINENIENKNKVTVAGWGNTNCNSNSKITPSKTLKKVSIPVWTTADCLKAYNDAHYDFTRKDYVCAGESEKDASKGDSGSPLMMVQNERWTAIGIVSAGRFMCEDRVPGVYTKISSYLNWIRSQIN